MGYVIAIGWRLAVAWVVTRVYALIIFRFLWCKDVSGCIAPDLLAVAFLSFGLAIWRGTVAGERAHRDDGHGQGAFPPKEREGQVPKGSPR